MVQKKPKKPKMKPRKHDYVMARTIRHEGQLYEKGKSYDLDKETLTAFLKHSYIYG